LLSISIGDVMMLIPAGCIELMALHQLKLCKLCKGVRSDDSARWLERLQRTPLEVQGRVCTPALWLEQAPMVNIGTAQN
jgi:hypothetical protein